MRLRSPPAAGFALAAIAALAVVVSACAPARRDGDGVGAAGDSARSPGAAPGATADTTFRRGVVVARGTARTFTGCGNTVGVRLIDRTGGALDAAVRALGGDGSGVYVEMNGGAPAGDTTTVVALEFLRASPIGEGGGCDRPPGDYVYQAFGNEPFWSVRVDTDSLVFSQPDEPSRVAWAAPAVVPSLDATGARTWTVEGPAGGAVLVLTIERGTCADGMSGETTTFRARARYGERTLEGCARAGTAADEVR